MALLAAPASRLDVLLGLALLLAGPGGAATTAEDGGPRQCARGSVQCGPGAVGEDVPVDAACIEAHPVCSASAANCSLEAFAVHCPRSCGSCGRHAAARACELGADEAAVVQLNVPRELAAPGEQPSRGIEEAMRRAEEGWAAPERAVSRLSEAPLVLQLDAFTSQEEAAELVAVAEAQARWQASAAGVGQGGSLNTQARNSSTVFCHAGHGADLHGCCFQPPVMRVVERLAEVLGLSSALFEYPQFVRYVPGQFYSAHSDILDEEYDAPYGPRIFTFFLYLTSPAAGGGTQFPKLGLRAEPAVGRALLWANNYAFQFKSKRKFLPDSRLEHSGEPVVEGAKYAMNIWIHNRPWKMLNHYGC